MSDGERGDDERADRDGDGGFRQDESDLLPEDEPETLAEKGDEGEPEQNGEESSET